MIRIHRLSPHRMIGLFRHIHLMLEALLLHRMGDTLGRGEAVTMRSTCSIRFLRQGGGLVR